MYQVILANTGQLARCRSRLFVVSGPRHNNSERLVDFETLLENPSRFFVVSTVGKNKLKLIGHKFKILYLLYGRHMKPSFAQSSNTTGIRLNNYASIVIRLMGFKYLVVYTNVLNLLLVIWVYGV